MVYIAAYSELQSNGVNDGGTTELLLPTALSPTIHVFGANFHLVQNRLKVDVTPISINSVNKLVG